eukprot:scaffold49416_cov55-Cyclotella_meneghiniana.AAC.3
METKSHRYLFFTHLLITTQNGIHAFGLIRGLLKNASDNNIHAVVHYGAATRTPFIYDVQFMVTNNAVHFNSTINHSTCSANAVRETKDGSREFLILTQQGLICILGGERRPKADDLCRLLLWLRSISMCIDWRTPMAKILGTT